ncbi:MAG: malto-oligosyltrehalose synthase [Bryobacteraceae bacterium]
MTASRRRNLARTPVSTYRLQLGPGMGFLRAASLVPYFASLGATELYASPLLAARPGSTHGYDLCDPGRLNPELGSEEDFAQLCAALRHHNFGLVLDFVPNHMGNDSSANLWWRDLLANGPSSPYARFFDVDWDPVKPELRNRILLPLLGGQYGDILAAGELQVRYAEGRFTLHYWAHDLPMNLRRMRPLLRHGLAEFTASLGDGDPGALELQSILFHLDHIPDYTESSPSKSAERIREIEIARERLSTLTASSPALRRFVDSRVELVNTPEGDNDGYRLLHAVLEGQVYRLAYWRTAMHEINYRRFFDINELAAIRMEDPEVFVAAHALVARLAAEGVVTGLRLDHVDGLYAPSAYFEQLAREITGPRGARLYVVAEKILSADEALQEEWRLHGTTGYDFLNDTNAVFIDGRSAARLRRIYSRFAGEAPAFSDVVYDSKQLIVASSMASELNVLAHELNRISESDWRYRDFTLDSLQEALREVVACFPVYRTYVDESGWSTFDQKAIETAIARALRRNPATEPTIFSFIQRMLLPDREDFARRAGNAAAGDSAWRRAVRFAQKFQQYTGPVQAKGVEDTAFYRYIPLGSQNEVGGEPSRFGCSVAEYHDSNLRRAECWPLTMLSSSTHDTKRGEDARARLNVLSEIPDEFRAWLTSAARSNAGLKTIVDGQMMPDRADEYLYYQALLGSWPSASPVDPGDEFVARMVEYMRKATKEKKIHTSWINPSEAYDRAVAEFVTRSLTGRRSVRFRKHFAAFHSRLDRFGMVNSLAQLVLKLCAPGIPDIYQGSEDWNFSLVDPDNRRTVDFETLAAGLARPFEHPRLLLENWRDGRVKLFVTAAGLRLRKRWPELFTAGAYDPVEVSGALRDHVVAFTRRAGSRAITAVVPRFSATLTRAAGSGWPLGIAWSDTAIELASGASTSLEEILTARTVARGPDGRIGIAALLAEFPVAILAE